MDQGEEDGFLLREQLARPEYNNGTQNLAEIMPRPKAVEVVRDEVSSKLERRAAHQIRKAIATLLAADAVLGGNRDDQVSAGEYLDRRSKDVDLDSWQELYRCIEKAAPELSQPSARSGAGF